MPQTGNSAYGQILTTASTPLGLAAGAVTGMLASTSKEPDYIVAIAGWPHLYSVVGTGYSLAGDLANFTDLTAIASPPEGMGETCQGGTQNSMSEAGSVSLSSWSVRLLDKHEPYSSVAGAGSRRVATDLASTMAYLFGNASGMASTTLTQAVDRTSSDILVASTAPFSAAGGLAYIGQECIHYTGISGGNTLQLSATQANRGYLLTTTDPHNVGVTVYNRMPQLYYRMIYVYKGFQQLTSTANWLRALSGRITGYNKDAANLTINMSGTTWDSYVRGSRKLFQLYFPNDPTQAQITGCFWQSLASLIGGPSTITQNWMLGSEDIGAAFLFPAGVQNNGALLTPQIPTNIGDGNHLVQIESEWIALCGYHIYGQPYIGPGHQQLIPDLPTDQLITAAEGAFPFGLGVSATTSVPVAAVSSYLVRGLFGTTIPDYHPSTVPVNLGWCSANYNTGTPIPCDPITLLLHLLISTGTGGNVETTVGAANYGLGTFDAYPAGIGLGIPQELINIQSFLNVQAEPDYGANLGMLLINTEPQDALTFIQNELCLPFGWYLMTGWDGRINLVQPRNPNKFYISSRNCCIGISPISGGIAQATSNPTIATGVYAATDLATAIQNALQTVSASFTCSYSTSTNKFTIGAGGASFSILNGQSSINNSGSILDTLKFSPALNTASVVSSVQISPISLTSPSIVIALSNSCMAVQDATHAGSQIYQATIPLGTYTGTTIATAIATALNSVFTGWTCTYSTSTGRLTLANGTVNFNLFPGASGIPAGSMLSTLSITPANSVTSAVSTAAVGVFTGSTLTQNDIVAGSMQMVDNRADQIASVTYQSNYNVATSKYTMQQKWIDATTANLGSEVEGNNYLIKSKGLFINANLLNPATGLVGSSNALVARQSQTTPTIPVFTGGGGKWYPPVSLNIGCSPIVIEPDSSFGIDNTGSWAGTFTAYLLDRYKQPPLCFTADLTWKWNLLQLGDIVQFSYTPDGALIDLEMDTSTIAAANNRLFEITTITPDFQNGKIHCTFVGHRWRGY